ncbi:MAG TPA: prolyl oligopeptidase family serine peptidase [Thermoanaerobaculia bacterium]|nr:prolyl oligopeptidase family serine peptidase [Thermoanaerobaculia bacterium]
MSRRSLSSVALFALLGFALCASALAQPTDRQTAERLSATVTKEVMLDYLLALPTGYSAEGEPWPLILFLHGAGERGDDLEKVKIHGPPKLIEAGKEIPAIVVSPQCPQESWWTDHLDALEALLDDLAGRLHVDLDRVYVTGISMGGYGTWALAASQPERFAAAAPICGGGSGVGTAVRVRELPVWAFHGDADSVVPLEESQRIVDAIERFGGTRAKLTVYPGVGHDSWTRTYEDPAFWEWLLAQRRGR